MSPGQLGFLGVTRIACLLAGLGACRTAAPEPRELARPTEELGAPTGELTEPVEPAVTDPLTDWESAVGVRGTSNDGTYGVKFLTQPEEVPLNEEFGLEVGIFDAAGNPAREVALSVDAGMPQHRHGMLRSAVVTRRPNGTFLVEGLLFHMPGAWELYFDVTHGAVTERAQFDVELD